MAEYTPEQIAAFQREYPEIEWRDGQPFTTRRTSNLPSDTDDPNQFAGAGETESLVPADLSEGGVPWWMWAALAGGPAAAEGIGAGLGALGLGGGGAGGGAAAGGTAASTAVPAGVGALPVGAVPTASILGPTGAGGLTAAGAGITPGVIAPAATAATTAATTAGSAAPAATGWLDRLKKYGGIARNIGGAFGGAAEASANAAESEALINANQYNTAQDAQMNLGRLDLDRNIEDRIARNKAARAALAMELFGGAGAEPTNVTSVRGRTPQVFSTGGGLSDEARARAAEIGSREMDRYRIGGGNTYKGGEIVPTPKVNVGGNPALNKAAFVTSLLSGWGSEDELEK